MPRALSPTESHDDGFPQFPRSERGPPSIISSRMTDIMTEDGGESDGTQRATGSQRKSALYSDATSRPGSARTGVSQRTHWTQGSLRRGLSGKRASGTGSVGTGTGSVGSTTLNARPASSMSRSHVPTLTSHAFFRPMSSQKLQAQRGLARPTTMNRQFGPQDEPDETNRDSIVSTNQGARVSIHAGDEGEQRPPPSRGTEYTEQEPFDRITATTSPTHGHYPSASVTDSLRPLQRKPGGPRNLTLDTNKAYKAGANVPTPVRTPHSLRSSFLLQRMDSNSGNREMEGGEKLESLASSPQHPPSTRDGKAPPPKDEKSKPKLGSNYEHFQGNTVFCLGGRLQNTRHRPVNIATGAFVVIPAILFLVFSAPWVWSNISPAIPITFAYLFFICFSSFFHASVSDPGVCPAVAADRPFTR